MRWIGVFYLEGILFVVIHLKIKMRSMLFWYKWMCDQIFIQLQLTKVSSKSFYIVPCLLLREFNFFKRLKKVISIMEPYLHPFGDMLVIEECGSCSSNNDNTYYHSPHWLNSIDCRLLTTTEQLSILYVCTTEICLGYEQKGLWTSKSDWNIFQRTQLILLYTSN